MADNITTTTTVSSVPDGTKIATRSVTYSGDSASHIAPTGIVTFSGSDDAKTATDVPAGGGVEATALRVTIASDSTGVLSVDDNSSTLSVDDGAGSLTVDNAGTFAVQVDGAALTALQLIDDAVFAEDVASQAADKGINVLAVRKDTAASLVGTDGDYTSLIVDNAGKLHVNVGNTVTVGSHAVTNAGTFAVQVDAALPAGTNAIGKLAANTGVDIGDVDVTSVVPGTGATALGKATDSAAGATDTGVAVLAVRDDTLGALTPVEGDYVPLRVNSTGALHVTGGGGGTQYTEDDAASPLTGTIAMAIRDDALAALTPVEGDAISLRVNSTGELWTTASINGAALTALQLIDDVVFAEDVASQAADKGIQILAVRKDTGAAIAGTDGDYTPLQTDSDGNLRVTVASVTSSSILVDDAAFTPATSNVAVVGGLAGTSDAVDANDAAAFGMTLGRSLWVAGAVADDAAVSTTTNPVAIGCVAAPTDAVVDANDVGYAGMTVGRAQYVSGPIADDAAISTNANPLPTGAVAAPTDAAVDANDIGFVGMTVGRAQYVAGGVADDAAVSANHNPVAIGAVATPTDAAVDANDVGWVAMSLNRGLATAGDVAHDAADASAPVKVGAKAETSPKAITLVSDGDRTDLYADADGMLMVKLNTSFADIVSERVTDTGGSSSAFTNFSAVASTKNYVTAITVYNASATAGYVDFRDGTAGAVLWTMPIPAGGGSVIASAVPLFKTSANTALAYDVSGALTTVYISVSGFQSKA